MALSSVLELALIEADRIKMNAPMLKQFPHSYRMAYCNIFTDILGNGLCIKISKDISMKDDYCTYNNYIYNMALHNAFSNSSESYVLNDFRKQGLKYCDMLNPSTDLYIRKICDVILSKKLLPTETDRDIINFYWYFRVIPLYFEIICGCHQVYDLYKRQILATEFNTYLEKVTEIKYKFICGIMPDYSSLLMSVKFMKDENFTNFTIFIDKYFNELNSKLKQEIVPEIIPLAPKLIRPQPLVVPEINKKYQIDETYNFKKHNYKKENLLTKAGKLNIAGYSKLNVLDLENLLLKHHMIKDESLVQYCVRLGIFYTDDKITESGYRTAILEVLTDTFNNEGSTGSLPKTIRSFVWDKYIGKEKGIAKCYICTTEINSKHFECGHIISKANGGADFVENLRCICSLCNKSIGIKNMDEFKKIYFQ